MKTRAERNQAEVFKEIRKQVKEAQETLKDLQEREAKVLSVKPGGVYKYQGKKFDSSSRKHIPCTMLVKIDDYNSEGFVGIVLASDCEKVDIMNTTHRVQQKAIYIPWEGELQEIGKDDFPIFTGMEYVSDELEQELRGI